jgi:hypothetical protein
MNLKDCLNARIKIASSFHVSNTLGAFEISLHTINTTRKFQAGCANVLTRVCLNFLRATGCMNPIVDIVKWAHNFGAKGSRGRVPECTPYACGCASLRR